MRLEFIRITKSQETLIGLSLLRRHMGRIHLRFREDLKLQLWWKTVTGPDVLTLPDT
jgi:hypothetical protein